MTRRYRFNVLEVIEVEADNIVVAKYAVEKHLDKRKPEWLRAGFRQSEAGKHLKMHDPQSYSVRRVSIKATIAASKGTSHET